jgi:hypothetical protein
MSIDGKRGTKKNRMAKGEEERTWEKNVDESGSRMVSARVQN